MAALVVLIAIGVPLALTAGGGPASARLQVGARGFEVPTSTYTRHGRVDPAALAALVDARVPAQATARAGRTTITYVYDRGSALRRLQQLGAAGGDVTVPRRAVAATIAAPTIRQALANDCEATALSIVMAVTRRPIDQRTLQGQLPRSGPLDPVQTPSGRVWGDPEQGFVGRPDGRGPAGGFGVYEGPVRQLAARHGLTLLDLTGSAPSRVFARVLAGHPVLAWVGLSDGPYDSWRSPSGRNVTVNFGEHAVVLTGLDRRTGTVTVDNPLTGMLETWSTDQFLLEWARLGRRALSA